MAISKRTRFEILKRDNFMCQYCGRNANSAPGGLTLEVDHKVPRSVGGSDDPTNLVTACCDCNRGKSDLEIDPSFTLIRRVIEDPRANAFSVGADAIEAVHRGIFGAGWYLDRDTHELLELLVAELRAKEAFVASHGGWRRFATEWVRANTTGFTPEAWVREDGERVQ